ncbi:hypothetical protein [Ferruginibacter albus]|uniref:hypothetical protein n=1 Tax=Ferruginibacter albus TaxID=2875540 RepID=UPI001CC4987A|nr:hypothetical protein [Ferruginibacter albus]UAY51468.1 hypothetical protein K9M53_12825 [Ferruginibacter albus]
MQFVVTLHSLVRWIILIFGFMTFFKAITGVFQKRNFTAGDNKANLFFMISFDVQLLIGLILYFARPWFSTLKEDPKFAMHDSYLRFFTVEHAFMMILAWILVHVGRVMVKKASTDAAKHKKALVFFGIALLLILISIPWPFREGIGRPWF